MDSDEFLKTAKHLWFSLFSSVFIFVVVGKTSFGGPALFPHDSAFIGTLGAVGLVFFGAAFWVPKQIFRRSKRDLSSAVLTSFIVRLALFEAIMVLGFVLYSLSHDVAYYAYFAAPAVFGFLISFPTVDNLRKMFGHVE